MWPTTKKACKYCQCPNWISQKHPFEVFREKKIYGEEFKVAVGVVVRY